MRKGDGVSHTAKKHALRMFVYLRAAGVAPLLRGQTYAELLSALSDQYQELPLEVQQTGRLLGRQLIRRVGYKAACGGNDSLIPPNLCRAPQPKCPRCRVTWLDRPKAVWPTKEEAERFCFQISGLRVYLCPEGHGYHVSSWHKRRPPLSPHSLREHLSGKGQA
jgi:hypothetical protein